jgi:hypothetical protein
MSLMVFDDVSSAQMLPWAVSADVAVQVNFNSWKKFPIVKPALATWETTPRCIVLTSTLLAVTVISLPPSVSV